MFTTRSGYVKNGLVQQVAVQALLRCTTSLGSKKEEANDPLLTCAKKETRRVRAAAYR